MYGIVANVASDRVLRTGAKVWILTCNGDASCPIVYGISKSGRYVQKYAHYKRLENFRAAWIPEHLRERFSVFWMSDRAEAEQSANNLAKIWAAVRYFNRDGMQLVRDGISEWQVWERYSAAKEE